MAVENGNLQNNIRFEGACPEYGATFYALKRRAASLWIREEFHQVLGRKEIADRRQSLGIVELIWLSNKIEIKYKMYNKGFILKNNKNKWFSMQ